MNIKDYSQRVDKLIEDSKQEIISATGVFWVIEMSKMSSTGVPMYCGRHGWTGDINLARKFLTKEDADHYICNVDPVLIGWTHAAEHAYF